MINLNPIKTSYFVENPKRPKRDDGNRVIYIIKHIIRTQKGFFNKSSKNNGWNLGIKFIPKTYP